MPCTAVVVTAFCIHILFLKLFFIPENIFNDQLHGRLQLTGTKKSNCFFDFKLWCRGVKTPKTSCHFFVILLYYDKLYSLNWVWKSCNIIKFNDICSKNSCYSVGHKKHRNNTHSLDDEEWGTQRVGLPLLISISSYMLMLYLQRYIPHSSISIKIRIFVLPNWMIYCTCILSVCML